jgi:hypothetical protein
MRFSCSWGGGISFLIGASAAILLGLSAPAAKAANSQTSTVKSSGDHWTVETTTGRRPSDKRYFIEFRARAAASYGHMYVLYGKVNGRDEIISSRIAGLHPAGDAENCFNCSLFNWTIGHIVPVPSETGASDGDLEEKYVTARYRVWMDYAHFKKLDTYIRKLQKDNPLWNALWNNCVEFGRSIAGHMGLKMPLFAWQEPKDFVTALREMNGMKKEQLPLKDAATGWSHTASRTPPLPPHRPKLEPVAAVAAPMSDAMPAAPAPQAAVSEVKPAVTSGNKPATASKDKPAAAPEAKPAATEAKPAPAKPKKVENVPAESTAVASTGSAH